MKFLKGVVMVALFSPAVLAACNSLAKPIDPTSAPNVELTEVQTKISLSPTLLPPTNITTPMPTWTLLPTLLFTDAHERQYLTTFSTLVEDVDISEGLSRGTVHLPLLKDQGTLPNTYYVKSGIVNQITAFNFDWAKPLYLSNFLNTYGVPDEIYFRVFYPGFQEEKFSFLVDLYYTNGILMEYSGGDETYPINRIHKNCYTNMDSPFINLWSPDENMTATEAIDTFWDNRNLPYPINLFDATSKDVTSFYNEFRDSNKVKCLETRQELWER